MFLLRKKKIQHINLVVIVLHAEWDTDRKRREIKKNDKKKKKMMLKPFSKSYLCQMLVHYICVESNTCSQQIHSMVSTAYFQSTGKLT